VSLEVRASDVERERVALVLRDHAVAGRLSLEELSARLEEAYAARTLAELERVTRELPDTPSPTIRPRPARLSGVLFGHVERKGRWRVARRNVSLVAWGDLDLDLRHAQIESGAVTLVLLVLFGNADVYVPEGLEVDVGGLTVFGHRHDWGRDVPGRPDAPLVRVRIFSLFGTADVWRVPHGVSGTFRELVQAVRPGRELDAG
jgi:hypothetical protein